MKIWIVIGFLLLPVFSFAQKVLLDEPVRGGDLTLFRDVSDANSYYYLADQVRLGQNENGGPQFSFLRYVQNIRSQPGEEEIREGEGGGIVHALFELHVSEEQLREARQALRRINSSATIKGPIIYEGGTVALVSSFQEENGEWTKKVVGLGAAPILDGQKVALSVQLTKLGAKILWESFQTPTPDFSISFQMEVAGYRSPVQAKIEADFDQVYKHEAFEMATVTPVFAGEIKTAFDELVQNGAITVTQIGEDEELEKALNMAYEKLIGMMFNPVGGSGNPNLQQMAAVQPGQKSMLDRATEMLAGARKEAREIAKEKAVRRYESLKEMNKSTPIPADKTINAINKKTYFLATSEKKAEAEPELELPELAVAASYELKEVKHSGKFTVDLNKTSTGTLAMRFDENIGQVDCDPCFREVNLDDPLYKQREIYVRLDGMNANDFANYVNFVNVLFRKTHQDGAITEGEVKIERDKLNETGNKFALLYGWHGDNDRSTWNEYEYKVIWNFFGGTTIESGWTKARSGIIAVSPPIIKKSISLEASKDEVEKNKIRSILVKLYYGNEGQHKEVRLNTGRNEYLSEVDIYLPEDDPYYQYEIIWYVKGSDPIAFPRKTESSPFVYVDEVDKDF